MKISVIGTGYVGLVAGTCFAEMGYPVTCIDIDEAKIATLRKGESPIYEPGLDLLLGRNIDAKRLSFSTNYDSIASSKIVFLAVGTPSAADGRADLQYLMEAAGSVASCIADGTVVVVKSTVPVGTGNRIREFIASKTSKKFYLVNNPEFLKEGAAVEDFMRPDRVIIGCAEDEAFALMNQLYAPLVRQGNPIYRMSNLSAEMTKYTANCFLATKISFINEIARLCDRTGADIEEVRKGITSDQRIGRHFLYAGPGYGGSCFPKDVKALMHTAVDHGMELSIVNAVEKVNETQKTLMFDKIAKHFEGELKGKTFAFWGVAFKPNTDDIREAPAIYMANKLVEAGCRVHFFDPVAADNFLEYMQSTYDVGDKVQSFDSKYDCLNGSSGIVVMTEWREFIAPDFFEARERMKDKVIFDARNIFDPAMVQAESFAYYGIGKRAPTPKA